MKGRGGCQPFLLRFRYILLSRSMCLPFPPGFRPFFPRLWPFPLFSRLPEQFNTAADFCSSYHPMGILTFRIPNDILTHVYLHRLWVRYPRLFYVSVFVSVLRQIPDKGVRYEYLVQIDGAQNLTRICMCIGIPHSHLQTKECKCIFLVAMVQRLCPLVVTLFQSCKDAHGKVDMICHIKNLGVPCGSETKKNTALTQNGAFGELCLYPLPREGAWRKRWKWQICVLPNKTRALLLTPREDKNDENGGCHAGKGMVFQKPDFLFPDTADQKHLNTGLSRDSAYVFFLSPPPKTMWPEKQAYELIIRTFWPPPHPRTIPHQIVYSSWCFFAPIQGGGLQFFFREQKAAWSSLQFYLDPSWGDACPLSAGKTSPKCSSFQGFKGNGSQGKPLSRKGFQAPATSINQKKKNFKRSRREKHSKGQEELFIETKGRSSPSKQRKIRAFFTHETCNLSPYDPGQAAFPAPPPSKKTTKATSGILEHFLGFRSLLCLFRIVSKKEVRRSRGGPDCQIL